MDVKINCPKCKSLDVKIDYDINAHGDDKSYCQKCGYVWYIEGPDS